MDGIPLLARGAISALADRLPYSAYGKNYLRMMSRPSALERYFENNTAPYFLRANLLQPDWILRGKERSSATSFPIASRPIAPES